MALQYMNYSSNHILEQSRNIRYANGAMLFGFYNTINVELELTLDVQQLFIQADVFARQILLHRSSFDLKRFLGQYQVDWQRLLMEAYVYDRLKAIYYGVNSINMHDLPSGLVSFPGNIMLSRILAKRTFNHSLNDSQPYSLFITLNSSIDLETFFEDVFTICPDLRQGFSTTEGVYTYVNSQCETILRGLYNGKIYLDSKKNKGGNNSKSDGKKETSDLFEMYEFDTDKFDQKMLQDSFPYMNGLMKTGFKSWFFYLSDSDSGPMALRFNESVFLGRAIGLTISDNVNVLNNNMYTTAPRNYENDPFTRDEVYSITALKSELTPYTMDEIRHYLGINSYVNVNNDNGMGGNTNTP